MSAARALGHVFARELAGYFATPLAYVFIAIFLGLAGILTFQVGGFLTRGEADLRPFFAFHPWLYTALVPAVAMRLWAEERRLGTIELLFSLPVSVTQTVIGKFLAAWCVLAVALAMTFPMWLTVAYLGDPDHGAILAGYVGSLALAGAYLAVGCAASAATRSQVVAYLLAVAVGFALTGLGTPLAQSLLAGWLPSGMSEAVAALNFLDRFEAVVRGVIDPRDVLFFASTMALFLFVCGVLVDLSRTA